MPATYNEHFNPESLAGKYWDAVEAHRKEIELIPTEEFDRRVRSVGLHQLTLSMLVDQLIEVSQETSPEAWFALADAYQRGRGAPKSRPAAMRSLQRAAEAGNISAMMRFANSLQHPDYENDPCRAVEWYRKVAERGHSTGMVSLGFSYREGQGVARDLGQAVHWFSKAVEAGDSHALIYIGRLYRDMPHRAEAVSWFLRAAETGHEEILRCRLRSRDHLSLKVGGALQAGRRATSASHFR
jgi:hypothetical protein